MLSKLGGTTSKGPKFGSKPSHHKGGVAQPPGLAVDRRQNYIDGFQRQENPKWSK